jgi:hypothetical protein
MNTTPLLESQPGVVENPGGSYHIHVKLNERGMAAGNLLDSRATMPPDTPVLAAMSVFEDCVLFTLQNGDAVVVHVSDPAAAESVVYFYRADGCLWRAVPLEQLNPGWTSVTYRFRGDLRKFDARLARMRSRPVRPSWQTRPTFWATAGWQGAVVYTTMGMARRVDRWQHSPLSKPQIATPGDEQVERLSQVHPADVQQLLAVREQIESKVTYQIGGLNLLLNYVERRQ